MGHPFVPSFRHGDLPYVAARAVQAFDEVAHRVDASLEDSSLKNSVISTLWTLREEALAEAIKQNPWLERQLHG